MALEYGMCAAYISARNYKRESYGVSSPVENRLVADAELVQELLPWQLRWSGCNWHGSLALIDVGRAARMPEFE